MTLWRERALGLPGGGFVVTDREYQRIKLDGYSKRQGGRPITANPYAGKPALRRQADAWAAGWGDANRDIRRRSNAVFH